MLIPHISVVWQLVSTLITDLLFYLSVASLPEWPKSNFRQGVPTIMLLSPKMGQLDWNKYSVSCTCTLSVHGDCALYLNKVAYG